MEKKDEVYLLGGVLDGARTKANKLVNSRSRLQYDLQGTRSGFGNLNTNLNATIQTGSHVPQADTLSMDFEFRPYGGQAGSKVKLNSDILPTVSQLKIYVGGALVVNLNKQAFLVAVMNKKLNMSAEELAIHNVKALEDVEMDATGATSYSCSIPMSLFGLDLKKLIPVGNTPINIQITLQSNVAMLLKEGSTAPTAPVNYELNNVKFSMEAYQLTNLGAQLMLKKVDPTSNSSSTKGIVNRFYGYDLSYQTLQQATTHSHQFNIKKRDIISTLLLPAYVTIPNDDIVTNSNVLESTALEPTSQFVWVAGGAANTNFVSNYRIQFTGEPYANVNGANGESLYTDHFEGVLRTAKPELHSRSYASEYSAQMARDVNRCQVLGGLFLKTPEDSQHATENGFNSLVGSSALVVDFDTSVAPSDYLNKNLVCLTKFKRQLELAGGVAKVVE